VTRKNRKGIRFGKVDNLVFSMAKMVPHECSSAASIESRFAELVAFKVKGFMS